MRGRCRRWWRGRRGCHRRNAATIATVAHRLAEFPRCAAGMRDGRLSLDQVGVIAERGGHGSDAHYAELAAVATVSQLRTAVKLEPRPDPDPRARTASLRSARPPMSKFTNYRLTLPHLEAAKFDAALAVASRGPDRASGNATTTILVRTPPGTFPTSGPRCRPPWMGSWRWSKPMGRRAGPPPHGQCTTVSASRLQDRSRRSSGPLLTDADRRPDLRRHLEAWFERDGQPIGAGRTTRQISRRLRRALDHRDRRDARLQGHPWSARPHCHWEDGGPTELDNLVLLCPYHHRLHHRGVITITGPADRLSVADSDGRQLSPSSLARPPTTSPPDVPPCPGPTGERADWWWYQPFEPQPPPSNN